jgi:CHAT domain-containing protein
MEDEMGWALPPTKILGRRGCSSVAIVVLVSALVTAAHGREQQNVQQELDRGAAERLVAEGERLRAKKEKASLEQAVQRFEQSIPLWQSAGDRAGEATALNQIGVIHQSLGDNPRALEYLQRAVALGRAVGEDGRLAETLSDLGAVYQTVGDATKALESCDEALRIARRLGDIRIEARTLTRIGFVYDSWGEYEEAVKVYSDALELARRSQDRRAEAAAIGNLGRLHQAAREHQKALDHFRQALALFQELDDRKGQLTAIHLVGVVYHSLGDLQKAIGLYEEGLGLARTLGDKHAEIVALNALGTARSASHEHRRGLELFDQALALTREVGDPRLAGYTLHNIGDAYSAMGESRKALEYELEALPLRRAVRDRVGEARVLIEIGAIYRALGDGEQALNAYGEALPIVRELGDRAGEALALVGLARLDRDAENLTGARTKMERALGLIESVRGTIAMQELRASYLATAQKEYEFYIDLLMQLHRSRPLEGFDALALHASERARARSWLELLTEAQADIRQGVADVLLERERSLQRRLSAKAERRMRMLTDPDTKNQDAVLAQDIERLTTELREVEGQIRASSPRYAALTQPQPLTVAEIQQHVLDAETLLLEYSLGEERSYLWAVSQTMVRSYELPKRGEIEALARRVYSLLGAQQPGSPPSVVMNRARIREADEAYRIQAAILSDVILGPAVPHLRSQRLLIVSDGALQYIPFAALPLPASSSTRANSSDTKVNGAEPLLIAEHAIVNVPSASTVAVLRRELAGRQPAAKTLAVIADPVFDSEDERVSRKTTRVSPRGSDEPPITLAQQPARDMGLIGADGRIARLPFTRREADSILALVPPGEAMKAIDFQASRATATSGALGRYRIVHFATHAVLNSEHPELSGVVLSLVDERGAPQDGFLRVHDLHNVNIAAELVVLSACQTGLGQEIRGEGLVGLTRGFMYAGAPRVMASLWKVEDAATAELMKRFYQGMFGEQRLSPAAALRAAQLALSRGTRWNAPYYWAAFVLQGEWQGWLTGGKGVS